MLHLFTEAVDCNHHVIVWNLAEHWLWENVYKVLPSVGGLELSWIILDCVSGFENDINSSGAVVLNAFEKALSLHDWAERSLSGGSWLTDHH